MIVRIWRTKVDEKRVDEYRRFAHAKSLRMFRQQPGFLGVLFAREETNCAVITLWEDMASVRALDRSETYQAVAAEIEATGLLRGKSTIEVLELDEAVLTRDSLGSTD